MSRIQVTQVEHTDHHAKENHFATNILVNANTGETPFGGNSGNPIGTPTTQTSALMETIGTNYVRYPAGQDREYFARTGILENGDLPTFVRNFLDHARDHGISVNIVVPVESLREIGGPSKAQILSDLPRFAAIIAEEYPNTVKGYELGNEYWQNREHGDASLEVEYGRSAAEAAIAISNGLTGKGHDPELIIQASGNLGSAYGNDLSLANAAIRDAFSSVAGSGEMIDGVLRNCYWRDRDHDGFENDSGIFGENRGLYENLHDDNGRAWDDWAGGDLTRYVGEYNLTNRLALGDEGIDLGIHGASMFLEHYANLVEAGVDVAFAWPILHSTRNAFVHRHEQIETTNVNGLELLTNSTRGAMFDLLRQTIVGDELIDLSWDGSDEFELTAFTDATKLVDGREVTCFDKTVFISSRTSVDQTISVDLSEFVDTYRNYSAVSIFYENSGGHQDDAVISERVVNDMDNDGIFDIRVRPYEVIQIVFEVGYHTNDQGGVFVSHGNDVVVSERENGSYLLGNGDDYIVLNDGHDRASGGMGNDVIYAGHGRDRIAGGNGDDYISGQNGNDFLAGGRGNDVLVGGHGRDRIIDGLGNDAIRGGTGNDIVRAGRGHDTIDAGDGDDRVWGGAGRDIITGGAGNDYLSGAFNADIFRFADHHGHDMVADFELENAREKLDFEGVSSLNQFDDVMRSSEQKADGTLIKTGADSSVFLVEIDLNQLTADHFVF